MINQIETAVRNSLNYSVTKNFEISDEKAFCIYVVYNLIKTLMEKKHVVDIQFERQVFDEADLDGFLDRNYRIDVFIHMESINIGVEFKYPKASDQQPVKKRAEIYQAIGRLVYLTKKGVINEGYLICATDNPAVYSYRGDRYPLYDGYKIPKDSYILPNMQNDEVEHHHSYGNTWNCQALNTFEFLWKEVVASKYRYLAPVLICNHISPQL